MGMDEHGQKVAQAAAARGVAPQALVDEIAASFQAMWSRLSISYDQFIRTTSAPHIAGVLALLERIFATNPDDFYERSYEGWYCVGCEAFKTDADIIDGKCVLHPTRTLDWVTERNWFFRLSRYGDFLRAHIDAHPSFIFPDSRRNEILALLERGLDDVSASRACHGAFRFRGPRAMASSRRRTCGSMPCPTISPPHRSGGPPRCTSWARTSRDSTA
jgi:methionyl-tRNA synthetase